MEGGRQSCGADALTGQAVAENRRLDESGATLWHYPTINPKYL